MNSPKTPVRVAVVALAFLVACCGMSLASAATPPAHTNGTANTVPSSGYHVTTFTDINIKIPINTSHAFVVDGCTMDGKFGNFYSKGYAQLAWRSGTQCGQGSAGVAVTTWDGSSLRRNPAYDPGNGHGFCSATTINVSIYGCTQLADGSVWNQPPDPASSSALGMDVYVCRQYFQGNDIYFYCQTWHVTF